MFNNSRNKAENANIIKIIAHRAEKCTNDLAHRAANKQQAAIQQQ